MQETITKIQDAIGTVVALIEKFVELLKGFVDGFKKEPTWELEDETSAR